MSYYSIACLGDPDVDLIEVGEFARQCAAKKLDEDAYGYPARNGKYCPDLIILPENSYQIPICATHIYWITP